jgi:hypothetical protein
MAEAVLGPPVSVEVDVTKTSSVLYPYQVTVDFSLWWKYGEEFEAKQDAEQSETTTALLRFKYRNVYTLGDDGLHLRQPDRKTWPDACWDQLYAHGGDQ